MPRQMQEGAMIAPYKTKGEERSLDYARDDRLGERLVDEAQAVGD